jgi:hypothetical protein
MDNQPGTSVCRFHIDGEMLGSTPGKHPLVEIGCCTVSPRDSMETFEVIICPHDAPYEYGAYRVLRRPYEEYRSKGIDPRDAAHMFIDFLKRVSSGKKIEISCVNPGFDFGFLKTFLSTYADDEVGVIGFKSYDVVSYACGVFRTSLSEMSTSKAWKLIQSHAPSVYEKYFPGALTHNALKDAIDQTMLLLALEECAPTL